MRLVTSLHLSLPVVISGRLEANHTLEGAGGSITSVDFDPSVSLPNGMGGPPSPGRWGLWSLREHMGMLELGPQSPLLALGDLGCGDL